MTGLPLLARGERIKAAQVAQSTDAWPRVGPGISP